MDPIIYAQAREIVYQASQNPSENDKLKENIKEFRNRINNFNKTINLVNNNIGNTYYLDIHNGKITTDHRSGVIKITEMSHIEYDAICYIAALRDIFPKDQVKFFLSKLPLEQTKISSLYKIFNKIETGTMKSIKAKNEKKELNQLIKNFNALNNEREKLIAAYKENYDSKNYEFMYEDTAEEIATLKNKMILTRNAIIDIELSKAPLYPSEWFAPEPLPIVNPIADVEEDAEPTSSCGTGLCSIFGSIWQCLANMWRSLFG